MCEDLLKAQVQRQRIEGISNGAVVAIDNRSHELLAAVGSVDFFNEATQGQVNGILAPVPQVRL